MEFPQRASVSEDREKPGEEVALLLIPMIAVPLTGGGAPPWFVVATDAFGWLSGITSLVLLRHRFLFLRQPQPAQRAWAVLAWTIHVAAFVMLMMMIFG